MMHAKTTAAASNTSAGDCERRAPTAALRLRRMIAAAVTASMAATTGCATMTRGTMQAWHVDSEPIGAIVSLSTGARCKTPCTLTLPRKQPFRVEVCKRGFAPVIAHVRSQVSGEGAVGIVGNVLIGGVIGAGVDAGSGATRDLVPNPLQLGLERAEPGCERPGFPEYPDAADGGAGDAGRGG